MTKSPVPAFRTIAALLALAMLGNGQSASPKTHFESASIHPAAVAPRDGVPRPIFVGGPGRLRSAWFMCHRIRWAMTQSPMAEALLRKLSGTVEVDETYVGGKEKGRPGKPTMESKKTPISD
jgi:hypothetical protein